MPELTQTSPTTWSGSATLDPGQVAVVYAEVDILSPSTVGFSIVVDTPAIDIDFTWDGANFTHSGDVPDNILGIELLNMTLPGDDCCEIWLKYVSETSVTTSVTITLTSGDGTVEHSSLTVA